MDRNKQNISRPGKSKIGTPHHGSEIFALGSKTTASTTNNRDESKNKVMTSASTSKPAIAGERKREASSTLVTNVAKKPKITNITGVGNSLHTAGFVSNRPPAENSNSSSGQSMEYWEQVAQECDTSDLVQSVLTAIDRQDSEQVVALLCGAIKAITTRPKIESAQSLSLLYLAKLRPNLFCNDVVTSALSSILRRDSTPTFKVRCNPSAHILAANLLARGYHNKTRWPDIFVRCYIEDAMNERVWVDLEECSAFVENISTAFGTKTPPRSMLQPEPGSASMISTISSRETTDEDSCEGNISTVILESTETIEKQIICSVQQRYSYINEAINGVVIEAVKEQLNRRQAPDCSTRNFLKFLATVSGISDVRAMAISRLELWIHNGKLMKPAQELLTYICYNVSSTCNRDNEVLSTLVRMRLKTKALINVYMNCIRDMIGLQPDILFTVLKNVVQNELSNARNPNNMGMGMLASIFQAKPDESAKHLATIYQEFLLQRDDCLRTLRVFLRELVKMLRYDIKLTVFCQALLVSESNITHQIENFEFRDRVFHATIDLVCLCTLLSVSPQIREANVLMRAGRETKGSKILFDYYDQMSRIQCEAVKWMFEVVPNLFKPSDTEYTQSLHKILLLDAPEQYTKGDQWPPEQERALLLRLVSEIPLHQDTIVYLALIGITKEIPVKIPDAMEIIEQVIRRSAGLRINDYPALLADKLEIIEFLFTMAEYHYPENIILPSDYEPPKLAISTLYWKAWNILLMLSAHNPSTFGAFCWNQYPMLRSLMEMTITNQFTNFKVADEELQLNVLEKTQILEFETHLAAATSKVVITESNSLLLSQLILMCPMGVARKPPAVVLEMLQNQNASLKLGHLLCRSRKPDLLLDIIQRQGTSQSMPWLADLVQNSEGDFNHLPVQCLCEFLLSNSSSLDNHRDLDLLKYLQNLLVDETEDHQASCEVLEYFLRRLASPSKQNRVNAIQALQLLLKVFHKDEEELQMNQDESGWLLHYLPMMPHFPAVRMIVIMQLRAACQIENEADLVMSYIQFIAANTLHDPVKEMLEHVMDLSQLIVDRNTLFSCIVPMTKSDDNRLQTLNCLFVMFNNYLIELKEYKHTLISTEYPDLVMVHFQDGNQQPIHRIIIHAFVILLTHASMIPNVTPILDYWFPSSTPLPCAFTLDLGEPVDIFPDWLKLKMIRSSVDQLVDVALHSLTPAQIVKFIQSFGIPVGSMSKLLAKLDRAVIEQTLDIKAAIANNIYFSQLVETQQSRGAKYGHVAIQTLKLDTTDHSDSTKREIIITKHLEVAACGLQYQGNSSQSKEIEEILEVILHNETLSKIHWLRFRRLIQQLLTIDDQNHLLKQQQNATSKVVQYLIRIAKSQNGQYFYQTILQNSFVCSFFRTMFISIQDKSSNHNCLAGIIEHAIQVMNPEDCPMLFQILFNKRKSFIKIESKTHSNVANQNIAQVLDSSSSIELEMRGNHLLNELIKNSTEPEKLIEIITTSLQKQKLLHSEISPTEQNKNGLLIDWLADIDSELVLTTENNLDLLFKQSLPHFRFYLLSLLSHQASWSTLHGICNKLLMTFNRKYDSTSVIHFVAALIRNPKLWQGREKNTSKHCSIEYVFTLNERQLKIFIDYILSEENLDGDKLSMRINALLQCIPSKTLDLKKVVSYVCYGSQVSDELKLQFMQHLYLNVPLMKFNVLDLNEVYMANAIKLINCETDKISNSIMTCISSLSSTKDFQIMSQYMEMLLRKLTASHPSLTLRQISMLAILLQGRAHMDFHVLRSSHHISLFIQVFGILELLQPQIFEDAYKESLHLALECYFNLFQYHGTTKDTFDLMYRFTEFLQIYTQQDSTSAWRLIEPHSELIEDLAADNRMIVPLQQLNQGVSLLKYRQNNRNVNYDISNSKQSNIGPSAIILTPYTKTLNQTLVKLLNEIQHRNDDEVLNPLQELEIITTKRQVPLESIQERLLTLISSSTVSIRNSAYMLLIRHLKSNPGNLTVNANTLTVYIQCLRKKDTGVVISALQFLTEMVICLQEYSSEILRNAFEMGIKSKVNTFEHIRKCVVALKTQHAC